MGQAMLWDGNVHKSARVAGGEKKDADAPAKKNNLVRKTFSILRAFQHPDEWLTSQELSKRAHMPKASGHRLVQTLEEVGAIVRGPHGRYRLGMLLLSLSKNVASKELLCEMGTPVLNDLAARLNLTVHLGMLENGMVFYVKKVSTPTSFTSHTLAGSHLEAYCSGLGKVLLAALHEDELESFILDGDLVALTPNTITERGALRLELERVRRQGFAFDDCESRADTYCVAVPLHDMDGNVVASISATGDAQSMTAERVPTVCDELMEAACLFRKRLYPGG
jgi:IclR family acetate operon transcriptional repressor